MADILIRGMEMPVGDDWRSVKIHSDGSVWRIMIRGDCALIKGATAIPLPEGHGRLIEADELDECYCFDEQEKYDNYVVPIGVIRQNIKDAATIVPAEGGNADGN